MEALFSNKENCKKLGYDPTNGFQEKSNGFGEIMEIEKWIEGVD